MRIADLGDILGVVVTGLGLFVLWWVTHSHRPVVCDGGEHWWEWDRHFWGRRSPVISAEQAQRPFPSGDPPSWHGLRQGRAGEAFWELQVFLTKCGMLLIRQFTGHRQDDKAKLFWRHEGKLPEGAGKAWVDVYLNHRVSQAVLTSPSLSPKQEIKLYELQWLRS